MRNEGPPLEQLTHRLAECPGEFLLPPRRGAEGIVDVPALVGDHFRALGVPAPTPAELAALGEGGGAHAVNRLRLMAVATWILRDDWFLARPDLARATFVFFATGFEQLAPVLPADKAVADPDRREELVRHCLAALNLRPSGETVAQATDRRTTLDSLERARVTKKTREAEARAREVREMMARRAAEEAAAKVSRE
jgi:hypothetical protein